MMKSDNQITNNIAEIDVEKLEQVTGGSQRGPITTQSGSGQQAGQQTRKLCKRCGRSRSLNANGYCAKCVAAGYN